jgi:7-cyano-7-deazaguanine synthase
MAKMVVVCSGGLDSVTLLYKTFKEHEVTSIVSFKYGQKHSKEVDFAALHAHMLNLKHHIIDLSQSGLTEAIASPDNALIGDSDVPEGHYAQDNMKQTVVPNRNMIMLSMALAIAVTEGAQAVATGVHAGDHFIYPDCRPSFILSAALAGYLGNEGLSDLWRSPIWAPFIHSTKAELAFEAIKLGIDFSQTWSCYKGGDIHCGKCGTCVERLEAIHVAQTMAELSDKTYFNIQDYTEYEDSTYWTSIVEKGI